MHKQLILLAHGSKNSQWCDIFESGLATINSHLAQNACLAYMEMASPNLESVIAAQYRFGIREFAVLPLFFAAGTHLLVDVPRQVDMLHDQYGDIAIELLEAAGHQEEFWQFLGLMIAKQVTPRKDVNSLG